MGNVPSTLHLILPEAELESPDLNARIAAVNTAMQKSLLQNWFRLLPDSFVYVERTLTPGRIRQGLVGKVDLESYDYSPGSDSPIRATEDTVASRLPPRILVRENASLELPHILLLADDRDNMLFGAITAMRSSLPRIYDFDLMQGGGHVTGFSVSGDAAAALQDRLNRYTSEIQNRCPDIERRPMVFVVGDGNHSLAAAKACWEQLKAANPALIGSEHPARYALVELENIHDPALSFEPIHRLVSDTDSAALLTALQAAIGADSGYPVHWTSQNASGIIRLDPSRGRTAVGILQNFLDTYLSAHVGRIDYIHGDRVLNVLAERPNSIGFLLPDFDKSELFYSVLSEGVLPRKTFSMGQANEKRFYLEARSIR